MSSDEIAALVGAAQRSTHGLAIDQRCEAVAAMVWPVAWLSEAHAAYQQLTACLLTHTATLAAAPDAHGDAASWLSALVRSLESNGRSGPRLAGVSGLR